MAACSVGVLVPEPANSPMAWPTLRFSTFTNRMLTTPGEQHADERDEIGLAPVGAGEAEEELLAVLHADGVEEEREPERAHHRRRRRLGREPADGERDEQHRADAEREALDVDLADEIADRDGQEQRHQRLLLEQRAQEFHPLFPFSRRSGRGRGIASRTRSVSAASGGSTFSSGYSRPSLCHLSRPIWWKRRISTRSHGLAGRPRIPRPSRRCRSRRSAPAPARSGSTSGGRAPTAAARSRAWAASGWPRHLLVRRRIARLDVEDVEVDVREVVVGQAVAQPSRRVEAGVQAERLAAAEDLHDEGLLHHRARRRRA